MINIKGLNKAKVLHALWHGSRTQGLSFLGLRGPDFTLERAEEIIKEREDKIDNPNYRYYFDYVDGHVIKCNIGGDEFDERLFDRDCGKNAAAAAIENLRNGDQPQCQDDNIVEMFKCIDAMQDTPPENNGLRASLTKDMKMKDD